MRKVPKLNIFAPARMINVIPKAKFLAKGVELEVQARNEFTKTGPLEPLDGGRKQASCKDSKSYRRLAIRTGALFLILAAAMVI